MSDALNTVNPLRTSRVAVNVAQATCLFSIVLLTVVNPGGRGEIALGAALLAVSAIVCVVAAGFSWLLLPPAQRRLFMWIIVAGGIALTGKTVWTMDLLHDGVSTTYPAVPDMLILWMQVSVAGGFLHTVVKHARRFRFETLMDAALVGVAAMILLIPMGFGEALTSEGAPPIAEGLALTTLLVAALSLLLLALLIAWGGDQFSRRALVGLAVGAVATAVFTTHSALIALKGTPVPFYAMDVLGLVALLGFVTGLDLPTSGTDFEQRVAERTAHLSGALQHLTEQINRERATRAEIVERERLASIGAVVAGAAHQVNNPLTAISAFAQLLLQEGSLTPDQRESVQIIDAEALRAAAVIRDLRAFARRTPGERRSVDLNELMERTVRLRSYDMNSAGVRAELVLDERLPAVTGDAHQLQQMLNNLIENSLQSMASKGGVLRVASRSVRDRVLLEIADTGHGIPAAARDRIFDPFFTTRPEGQGTGLGLSVAYGLAASHGGAIKLTDGAPGHTTFVIELPAARAAVGAEGAREPANSAAE